MDNNVSPIASAKCNYFYPVSYLLHLVLLLCAFAVH